MSRPSFRELYMNLAFQMSRRSTCLRKSGVDGSDMHVGCAIVSADWRRVLACGYNGNASGLPNRCDFPDRPGACLCLHAETNAVISCIEPRSTAKVVFTTHSPCVMCAKSIVQLGGVETVYYAKPYRDDAGVTVLLSCNIACHHMDLVDEGAFLREHEGRQFAEDAGREWRAWLANKEGHFPPPQCRHALKMLMESVAPGSTVGL